MRFNRETIAVIGACTLFALGQPAAAQDPCTPSSDPPGQPLDWYNPTPDHQPEMTAAQKGLTPITEAYEATDITIPDYPMSDGCIATPLPYNGSFALNPYQQQTPTKKGKYLLVYRYDNIPRAWKFFRAETQSYIGIRELDENFEAVTDHAYLNVRDGNKHMLKEGLNSQAQDPRLFTWKGQLYVKYSDTTTGDSRYVDHTSNRMTDRRTYFAPISYNAETQTYWIDNSQIVKILRPEVDANNYTVDGTKIYDFYYEKNYITIVKDNDLYFVRNLDPFDVYKIASVDENDKNALEATATQVLFTDYKLRTRAWPEKWGSARGGSMADYYEDAGGYYAQFHSSTAVGDVDDQYGTTRMYYNSAIVFNGDEPFGISSISPIPFYSKAFYVDTVWPFLEKPDDEFEPGNASVPFISGQIVDGNYTHVTVGLNDSKTFYATLDNKTVLSLLQPISKVHPYHYCYAHTGESACPVMMGLMQPDWTNGTADMALVAHRGYVSNTADPKAGNPAENSAEAIAAVADDLANPGYATGAPLPVRAIYLDFTPTARNLAVSGDLVSSADFTGARVAYLNSEINDFTPTIWTKYATLRNRQGGNTGKGFAYLNTLIEKAVSGDFNHSLFSIVNLETEVDETEYCTALSLAASELSQGSPLLAATAFVLPEWMAPKTLEDCQADFDIPVEEMLIMPTLDLGPEGEYLQASIDEINLYEQVYPNSILAYKLSYSDFGALVSGFYVGGTHYDNIIDYIHLRTTSGRAAIVLEETDGRKGVFDSTGVTTSDPLRWNLPNTEGLSDLANYRDVPWANYLMVITKRPDVWRDFEWAQDVTKASTDSGLGEDPNCCGDR